MLLIEDEASISGPLAEALEREGWNVDIEGTGTAGLEAFERRIPDLILLDLMLPGESGIRVCERIREEDREVVIVMVTAKDAEEDKVRGFEAGADDYVTKPFGKKELVARINANLKRSMASPGTRGKVLEAGASGSTRKLYRPRVARVKGEPLDLRLIKEFELLAALATRPGEPKSRKELAKEVWGYAGLGSSRTIDVHIRRIRASLAKSDYEYVHTAWGLSYHFEARPKGLKEGDENLASERETVESRE